MFPRRFYETPAAQLAAVANKFTVTPAPLLNLSGYARGKVCKL